MNKRYLLLILVLILFSSNIYAKNYHIDSLGLDIDIDYNNVITRDNYLESDLSITNNNNKYSYYQYMNDNYIYLETYNNNINFMIRAIGNPGIEDFSLSQDITSDISSLSRKVNESTYSLLELDEFKLVRFVYYDDNNKIYFNEYFLSWKDVFYTFTFSSNNEFSSVDINSCDNIMKTLKLTGEGKVIKSNIYEDGIDTKNKSNSTLSTCIFISIILIVSAIVIRKIRFK